MLIPKFDIYNTEWLDLVFKGRNQSYGAYELRKHYTRTLFKAMGITAGILGAVFLVVFAQSKPAEISVAPASKPTKDIEQTREVTFEQNAIKPTVMPHEHNGERLSSTGAQSYNQVLSRKQPDNTTGTTSPAPPKPPERAITTVVPVPQIEEEIPIAESVDAMPQPNGGRATLDKFFAENLRYPEDAAKNGISGRVWLGFVVEKNGQLSDIQVIQSAGHGFDEEAVRVLKLAPSWQPGAQNGQPVRVRYKLPVNFRIIK